MTTTAGRGREAFARQAWAEAVDLLAASGSTDGDDLECLAVAAHLVGRDEESARALEDAHGAFTAAGDDEAAARCAFWLCMLLLLRGEMAQGSGWLARADRALGRLGRESATSGLLLVPPFLEAIEGGDVTAAAELTETMIDIAQRFDDADVFALAMLCGGEAAIALGETSRGIKMLDEAMLSVTTGGVSPIPSGIVYCATIEACMNASDLRRAAEWTDALHRWCGAQPDLVPYRGQCLVHRSQVLQAHGAWAEALSEAERARAWLSEPAHPALGLALYQEGELHRLRGELADADRAYRAAGEHGREPAPGIALLRLAERDVRAASAAIRRMVEETRDPRTRPPLLAAAVEIELAAGDVVAARAACDELAAAAAGGAPLVQATAAFAVGSVRLAEGDARGALAELRRACSRWRDLEVPYDTARARMKIGLACRALGDHDAADLELRGARDAFERLGARPDLRATSSHLAASSDRRRPGGLTDREQEVLRLVAAGKANREIASDLVISEHTVARHLQNIFTKLGISSRAAATAFAYEHGLV